MIAVNRNGSTSAAQVTGEFDSAKRSTSIVSQSPGRWLVDGRLDARFDGCLDVDLESSALTNALPVRRMALKEGSAADAPALFVRAADLRAERLEQRYARLAHEGPGASYHYVAPAFAFTCTLRYDQYGLVLDYPGIATRIALERARPR